MKGKPKPPPQTLFALHQTLDPALIERRRRDIYSTTFSSPFGAEVLADIIMSSGFLAARGPVSAQESAFNDGVRWAVAEILRKTGIDGAPLAGAVIADNLMEAFNAD